MDLVHEFSKPQRLRTCRLEGSSHAVNELSVVFCFRVRFRGFSNIEERGFRLVGSEEFGHQILSSLFDHFGRCSLHHRTVEFDLLWV